MQIRAFSVFIENNLSLKIRFEENIKELKVLYKKQIGTLNYKKIFQLDNQ